MASVVFVHGLFGHPVQTWTQSPPASADKGIGKHNDPTSLASAIKSRKILPWFHSRSSAKPVPNETSTAEVSSESLHRGNAINNRGVFWIQDILPDLIDNIRIFTFGYDVDVVHFNPFTRGAGQASVYQHAKTLLNDLADARTNEVETKRPLIFVVHSLGGIVVKDALAQSRMDRTHLNVITPAVIGVCFLGTPHRGSGSASLGRTAAEISKLTMKSVNDQVLRTLETQSSELERIGFSFAQILVDQKIGIHSFCEEYPTSGVMIVGNSSYSIGDGREGTGLIPSTHSNMTKYSSRTDKGLQRIVKVLERWLEAVPDSDTRAEARKESCKCANSAVYND